MENKQFPTAEQIAQVRSQYPKDSRVELVWMDDPQAPLIGTKGTVIGMDDIGSIMVAWDNGSHLNVAYGEDIVRLLPKLNEIVMDQILAIRDTGLTNMFDKIVVQRLALERCYHELVNLIEFDTKSYITFIMTGKAE